MSQEIRKARLREIAQQSKCTCDRRELDEDEHSLLCPIIYTQEVQECIFGKTVPIAAKRVKEGLGAVRD